MKSSREFPLRQSGIYRNLPTIDPSVKGLEAIITGATGISGWNTIRCLLDSPERWSKIYALSRRPPSQALLNLLSSEDQKRVIHVPVDLLQSSEDIAKSLNERNVTGRHVFYYAYIQPKPKAGDTIWSDAQSLADVNETMFSRFLEALPLAKLYPQRILLQTGGKNYGVQFGRTRQPCVESDNQPKHLGPNFYYGQEESLFSYCAKNPEASWNVIRPGGIIGSTNVAQMNMAFALGTYVVVQSQKGQPLSFPADWDLWQDTPSLSTARLTGYLSEWAILEEDCKNHAFNSEDGNSLTWDRLFQELARWFDVKGGAKGPAESTEGTIVHEAKGGKESALGCGPSIMQNLSIDFDKWIVDPVNAKVWKEATEGCPQITSNPFEDNPADSIGILDVTFTVPRFVLSMNKARRFGWNGYVDTLESIFEALEEMAQMGLIPPMATKAARPLI